MDSEWKDCITIFFDLDGTKRLAPTGLGSSIMQELHTVVARAMDNKNRFPSVGRAYAWNDSVLLLAYVGEDKCAYERALRDAAELKPEIDAVGERYGVGKSYAVAVKGQAFPPPKKAGTSRNERFVFIEASSYAMANSLILAECFKENPHSWYIDERISNAIRQLANPVCKKKIRLLPKHEERTIYAYDHLSLDHVAR